MWLFNNAYWLADDDAVLVYKLRISAGLANEASIVSAAQCWCWGRPCQPPPAQTPDNPKYVGNPAASSLGAPPTKVSFLMDGWIVHLYYLLHHVALSLDISAFPAAAAEASTKLIFDQHPRQWPLGAVRAVTTTMLLSPTPHQHCPQPITAQPWSARGPERRCLESLVLWPLVSCSGGQLELA